MLRVHSIESLGTYDGPGIRLIVFLQGCNFKCSYCANVDTIPLVGGDLMQIEDIVAMAINQKPFFGKKGGVTISGGEPLLQAKELIPLFKRLREENINTCIDTNGSVFNDSVKELLEYTDLVLLDIKHINEKDHVKITSKKNQPTLELAEYLKSKGKRTWLRYVLVPTLTDNEEDLNKLGKHFENFSNIEKLEIQPYHSLGVHKYEHMGLNYTLKDIKKNTPEQLNKAQNILEQYFKNIIVN
ncbi:pyruvate formate lyase activating enzyme [Balneicella halophila]|uniref:Pyruvate formate-lyase-activating enzyme n=1 Tax=Balneicella halophila TaxID=1537566 RepID=A0A7L4UMJ9_BALHA|nr:pyruvate formate-lyase-activating protein [Balneicella halophila]PVX49359.1 pyruvate formate lyase activating enzyme [Balneicella halophila]